MNYELPLFVRCRSHRPGGGQDGDDASDDFYYNDRDGFDSHEAPATLPGIAATASAFRRSTSSSSSTASSRWDDGSVDKSPPQRPRRFREVTAKGGPMMVLASVSGFACRGGNAGIGERRRSLPELTSRWEDEAEVSEYFLRDLQLVVREDDNSDGDDFLANLAPLPPPPQQQQQQPPRPLQRRSSPMPSALAPVDRREGTMTSNRRTALQGTKDDDAGRRQQQKQKQQAQRQRQPCAGAVAAPHRPRARSKSHDEEATEKLRFRLRGSPSGLRRLVVADPAAKDESNNEVRKRNDSKQTTPSSSSSSPALCGGRTDFKEQVSGANGDACTTFATTNGPSFSIPRRESGILLL